MTKGPEPPHTQLLRHIRSLPTEHEPFRALLRTRDLPRNVDLHEHNTRHGQDFPVPPHRKLYLRKNQPVPGRNSNALLPDEIKKNQHSNKELAFAKNHLHIGRIYLWRQTI
ncbi:hypothetical protein J6590_059714 [Homalodisca vitripennis]|nr:hypothetical protein J6590_059714 [Homalodisca vitripennis]